LIEEYKGSNILILNCVYPRENKDGNNLNLDNVEKLIKEAMPKLCIITHFGVKLLKSEPLYLTRELQKKTGVQIIAAKDGMMIDPTNYSANLIQKTLNLYPASK